MVERIVILFLSIAVAIASLILRSRITIIISDHDDVKKKSQNYFRSKAEKLTRRE